jgi:sec-independent protein translocase protein TatC
MSQGLPHDPDDFFADTRMSFGDHIEELRTHLWRAIYGFGVALFISFFFGHYVLQFITAPLKTELSAFYKRRTQKVLRERLEKAKNPLFSAIDQPTQFTAIQIPRDQWLARTPKEVEAKLQQNREKMARPVVETPEEKEAREGTTTAFGKIWNYFFGKEEAPPQQVNEKTKLIKNEQKDLVTVWIRYRDPIIAESLLQEQVRLFLDTESPATLNVQEAFVVWFKVCIVCGIVIGSPWIFWQIWAFIAVGLYPSEKKLVRVYLPVSLGLFLFGVFMCEFYVIPKALSYLLWFNEWMGLKPTLRLNEWLGFAIFLPLVFGLCFQTPLVMLALGKMGIMSAQSFREKRRFVWFGMAVFSAAITPPDAVTLMLLWVPMGLLYELGIWLILLSPTRPWLEPETEESDELVEV